MALVAAAPGIQVFRVDALLGRLVVVGIVAALAVGIYFLTRGLREGHVAGEYHFTWGVSIVVLLLLGLLPGIVGVGMYLTIERGYPTYWLVVCLAVAALAVGVASIGVSTDITGGVGTLVAA